MTVTSPIATAAVRRPRPGAVVEQHRDVFEPVFADRHVEPAVAVEVADRDRRWAIEPAAKRQRRGRDVPSPVPSSTLTVPLPVVVTTSSLPSPLKSASATAVALRRRWRSSIGARTCRRPLPRQDVHVSDRQSR